MRWQRPARYAIAVAGLGFAALLYVRFDRKPAVPAAPLPQKLADGASYQSVMSPGGKQVRYKDGVEVGAVSYATLTQFTDGRRVIEKPRFEGDRNGKPFIVTADRGELKAPGPGGNANDIPEETHLMGNVVMQEKGGMEIKTDDAMYRESVAILDVPGSMIFTDDRTSGSGLGAIYDRNGQLLTLKDQAVIAIAPDDSGQGRMDASAKSMLLNRGTHFVSLDGNASIVRDREVISAASAQMHLSDDNSGVQMMQLRQNSSIVPLAGVGGKTPEMRGDDIDLEFQADGRTIKHAHLARKASMLLSSDTGRKQVAGDNLDVSLAADGQTVTRLVGDGAPVTVTLPASKDVPQRVISGRTLDSTGDEKNGLTAAVFKAAPAPAKDQVEFVELKPSTRGQVPARRTVRAQQLVLSLNAGDLSDIKDAHFSTSVDFADGATTGQADDVTYVAAAGKLILRPASATGNKSHVATGRIDVSARNIDIELDKIVITATIDLTTQTTPDKSASSKGLFDEAKPMRGKANELHYEDAKNQAVYTGKAWLGQGSGKDESFIAGEKVTVDSAAGDLSAEGKVSAKFPIDNLEGSAKEPPSATAGKFEYKDATHRALYTGTEKERAQFNSPDGVIKGVTIEMFLSDAGRELKTMIVDAPSGKGLMQARIAATRTAIGDRMVHDVKAGTYQLIGSPARVIERSVDKGAESCTESRGTKMSVTKTGDAADQGNFSVDATKSGTTTRNLPNCADWSIK